MQYDRVSRLLAGLGAPHWQPGLRAQSPLQSNQAMQRAERILSEPYAVPHNLLLEQGILFLVSGILPMLFC